MGSSVSSVSRGRGAHTNLDSHSQNFRLATRLNSRGFSFNRSQNISGHISSSHDSQSKHSHAEVKADKIQKEEEEKEEESFDWRSILAKMNQSVSEVKAIPKEPDPPVIEKSSPPKDFTDIKLEYRRIKIREQCKKLNTKVSIPSRSSWRDRINGGGDSTNATSSSSVTSSNLDSESRRNLTWGQRRTKVYHINSDIEVHKFKIIDTIHLKRSQIEARLAEYNKSVNKTGQEGPLLMLTYTDQDYLNMLSAAKAKEAEDLSKKEIVSPTNVEGVDPNQDQNLDGLSLKDNTKKKLSQFNKNITDKNITMKVNSPTVPKKKKYNSSVDWREELKNRDRAKQLEDLKRYKVGMPDYKEPEKEEAEKAEEKKKVEQKSKSNWKRISLKPTSKPDESKKEKDTSNSKPDEPFKVSLRPVRERRANNKQEIQNEKDSSVPHQSSSDNLNKMNKEKNLETAQKEKAPLKIRKSLSKQELESFETEIANALENEHLNNGYLKDLLIEIIKDNPDLSKAEVKKAKVQTCPKPKVQTKQKESFEDRYFKPKRKKMLDYFPETVPLTLRKPEEIHIEPMKFSSVSDNCVTKSLFIGSQYTGQRH